MSGREIADETTPLGIQRIETELLGGTLDREREAERLRVVGEPTRFAILYLLTEDGERSSGELATLLDRNQNDLYHHLNTLEEAGLVGKYREEGSRIYELSPLAEELVPVVFESIRERSE